MTELTPAVQDAAYRFGQRMKAAGFFCPLLLQEGTLADSIELMMMAGWTDFTPEAEAERVEAVREAGR